MYEKYNMHVFVQIVFFCCYIFVTLKKEKKNEKKNCLQSL